MDHRFQVFVSSTYSDLIEERIKVAQAVVEADCFPAGMEAFPASGDEQFEYIKKIIDQSDYYVLIIGGRYGSRAKSGVSYTEQEFDYANKIGLPILVFPHARPDTLPPDRRDGEPESQELLAKFRAKALSGRLAKMWTDADGLANQVMRSLLTISRDRPGIGWLRASRGQLQEIQNQTAVLAKENESLVAEVSRLESLVNAPQENLSGGDDAAVLEYVYQRTNQRGYLYDISDRATATWNEILHAIGPELLNWRNEATVSQDVAQLLALRVERKRGKELSADSLRTLRIQFLALNLIEIQRLTTVQNSMADFWRLTESGRHKLFQLRPIRKT